VGTSMLKKYLKKTEVKFSGSWLDRYKTHAQFRREWRHRYSNGDLFDESSSGAEVPLEFGLRARCKFYFLGPGKVNQNNSPPGGRTGGEFRCTCKCRPGPTYS